MIVTELSRLGPSTGAIIVLINQLVAYGVIILTFKQNLHLGEGLQDRTAKVMVTLLALFAEIERGIFSIRTKEALAAKKNTGFRPRKTRRHDSVQHV